MNALVVVLVFLVTSIGIALLPDHEHDKQEQQDFERRRIDQATQNALDDIRRRRERAEDQLRRLSRWQR